MFILSFCVVAVALDDGAMLREEVDSMQHVESVTHTAVVDDHGNVQMQPISHHEDKSISALPSYIDDQETVTEEDDGQSLLEAQVSLQKPTALSFYMTQYGATTIVRRDIPYVCKCNHKGYCISSGAETGASDLWSKCYINRGNMPDVKKGCELRPIDKTEIERLTKKYVGERNAETVTLHALRRFYKAMKMPEKCMESSSVVDNASYWTGTIWILLAPLISGAVAYGALFGLKVR